MKLNSLIIDEFATPTSTHLNYSKSHLCKVVHDEIHSVSGDKAYSENAASKKYLNDNINEMGDDIDYANDDNEDNDDNNEDHYDDDDDGDYVNRNENNSNSEEITQRVGRRKSQLIKKQSKLSFASSESDTDIEDDPKDSDYNDNPEDSTSKIFFKYFI